MPDTPPSTSSRPGPEAESPVLVVDDAAVDRRIAGALIEQGLGWPVVYANHGAAALESMAHALPRVVVTDLIMPEMDGLELVAAIREQYPLVPVILMTAFGNEEIALQALQAGAASYVRKASLERDLAGTLERVAAAAQVERRQQRLLDQLEEAELRFVLDNDPAIIPVLVAHLQQYLERLGLCDPTGKTRVGVALEEALLNAIYHGNLEVSSDLRQDGEEPFQRLAQQRRHEAPYKDRRVHCISKVTRSEAIYVIRDDGPGFDPGSLPDPTDPANLDRVGGRGLLLIQTFMDEVTYNATGNQITLVKRRDKKHPAP